MSNMYDFNSTFFLSVGTLIITGSGVCLGYALKSKCNNVKVCYGCLEIERDVDLEADIEENTIQQQQPQTIDIIPTTAPQRTARRSYNLSEIAKAALEAEEKVQEIDFSKSMTKETN